MSSPYPVAILGLALWGCEHRKAPAPGADAGRTGSTSAAADRAGEDRSVPVVDPSDPGSEEARHLVATVKGTEDHPSLAGVVHLVRSAERVEVSAELRGLPSGPHGWHVHLLGDCSDAADGSAGPHLDFGALGGPGEPVPRHITGNLGELVAGADGTARATSTVAGLEGEHLGQLTGRAVVVHEGPNDPAHPPDGAAGTPIGCGVLGVAPATGS